MMLLISMAITVAYTASMATSLGWFDLDFWWELAALVTIMLLGHWQEMKAIGQARGRTRRAGRADPRRRRTGRRPTARVRPCRDRRADRRRHRARPLRWSGARRRRRSSTGEAELDESMITGESRPVAKREGDRVVAGTVSTDSSLRVRVTAVGDDTALAGIQRMVADAQASQQPGAGAGRPVRRAALLRRHRRRASLTLLVWTLARRRRRRGRQDRHRAGHRLPPRARPGHPAGHRHLDRGVGPGRDPGQGPPRPGAHAHHRHRAVRQDRHAHQGRPRRHRRRRGRRDRPTRMSSRSPARSRATANTPSPGPSPSGPARTGALADRDRLPVADRAGRRGHRRRRPLLRGRAGPAA